MLVRTVALGTVAFVLAALPLESGLRLLTGGRETGETSRVEVTAPADDRRGPVASDAGSEVSPLQDATVLTRVVPGAVDHLAARGRLGGGVRPPTSGGEVLGFGSRSLTVAATHHVWKVDLVGANRVTPVSRGSASANGSDASAAQPFRRVEYANAWKGVTLAYAAHSDAILESSYTIAGGTPVSRIRLHYNVRPRVDGRGNLVVRYPAGTMVESAPVAWQTIGDKRIPVRTSFRLLGGNEVGFAVGNYDHGKELVIDPVLSWNTFLGNSANPDMAEAITRDASGNVYVTGYASGTWGAPIQAFGGGSSDAFVARLDSSGNLLWSTFLGGNSTDFGGAVAVDSSGNVYAAGYSQSTWGSPIHSFQNVDQAAFVAKLNSNGVRQWNTFLGNGAGNSEISSASGIAVDSGGNVFVAGTADSNWGSPILPKVGLNDVFVSRLANAGSVTWNTFLGSASEDWGSAIAVDGSSNVYIEGMSAATWGSPVRAFGGGAQDDFAAKLTGAGALTWSTFLGGAGTDSGGGLAVDVGGNVFVSGSSDASWGTPVRAYSAGTDGFAAELTGAGSLSWNTFVGGGGTDRGAGIALDTAGSVLLTGDSDATWGAPARAYSAQRDAVAVKLTGTGDLAWNTFLGGTGTDIGYGIFPDGGGDVYVAGSSTSSWGSPILAFGNDNQYDAFVSSIWAVDPPVVSVPGAQSLSEDVQRIFSSGNGNGISIGDPDIGASADEVTLNVAHGTLTLAGTAGLTFSAGDGTADSTMTFRGSISAINTALDGLSYLPAADYYGSDTLKVAGKDSALTAVDIDNSLLGRYTFENTGALGTDTSPAAGHSGTATGATAVADATRGNVLGLAGAGYVQIPGRFGNPANLTLAAWVNMTAPDTDGGEVISLGDSALIRVDQAPAATTVLSGSFYKGGGPSNWTTTNFPVTLAGTGWHHVAYTFNDAGNTATLYLDGTVVATTATTASISYTLGADSFIGKHGNGETIYDFNGKIDEARIYNRVLAPGEIAALATDQTLTPTGTVATTVNPVADTPSVTGTTTPEDTQSSSGLVISRNAVDGAEVTHFKITGISNGTLYQNDGTTAIPDNSFVNFAEGNAGLKFTPAPDFSGSAGFTVQASTSATDAGLGGATVNPTVTVSPVNDAPLVTTTVAPLTYAENDPATPVDPGVSVSDVDNASLASATVQITSNYAMGQDVLSFANGGGITGSWNVLSGTLTLTGPATVAGFEAALRTVRYSNSSESPSVAARTVSFTVDDGSVASGATRTVTVAAVNDAPTLGDGALAAVTENPTVNGGQTLGVIFGAQFADVDAGSAFLGVAVVANTASVATEGVWQYSTNAGASWYPIGAVTDGSTALALSTSTLVRFAPVAGFNGTPAALAVRGLDNSYAGGFSSTSGAETRVTVDTTASGGSSAIAAATSSLSTTVRPRGVVVTTAADIVDGNTSSLAALAADRGADGEVSLREAIAAANNSPDRNDIAFDIAGAGVETIALGSALPAITDPVTIDGYTEPGASTNTSPSGDNAVLLIELDGSGAGSASGLDLGAGSGGSTISGLVINGFALDGIQIGSASNVVTGTFVGTDADGTSALPNGRDGIRLGSGAAGSLIGGTTPAGRNVIAFNSGAGVDLPAGSGSANRIQGNAIFSNGGLGIDLNGDGVTLNDPGDGDGGPNDLKNLPVLSEAFARAGQVQITGTYDSLAVIRSYRVEFFASAVPSPGADPTGYGEGQRYLGFVDTTTNLAGHAAFTTTLGASVAQGEIVAATVTDPLLADTSEFSLSIAAISDHAPVLTPASPILTPVTEDEVTNTGQTVASFLGSSVSDVDGDPQGIAIDGLTTGNGHWELSLDGGLNWAAVGSVSDAQALLLRATDRVRFVPNGRNGTSASLTYRAWDQTVGVAGTTVDVSVNGSYTAYSAATDSASIPVSPVNDAPTLGDGILAGVAEDPVAGGGESIAAVFSGQFADVDTGSSFAGVAVVGNGASATTEGIWQYSTDGGANWFPVGAVADDSTALALSSSTLVRFAPVADYNGTPGALHVRGVDDSYAGGFSSTGAGEARVLVDTTINGDPTSIAATAASLTTSVSPVDDAPVVATSAGALAYVENGSMPVDPGLTVDDVDSAAVVSATVQVTGNYVMGEDVLSFADAGGITGGWDVLSGTLTLTGPASVAGFEAALRSVVYANSSENPSSATRTVSFTVNDGGLDSVAATRTVTVGPVNDPPVVTTTVAPLSYAENDAATAVDTGVTVSDVDSAAVVSATVQVTGNYVMGEDVLSFADAGGITGGWDVLSGTLTLTGPASVAGFEAALRSVVYANSSENPSSATRTVSFTVNDGGLDSVAATRTVTVGPVNDPPVVTTTVAPLSYAENDAATAVDTGVTVSDVDSAAVVSATVQVTGNYVMGEDVLSFADAGGITGGWDVLSGTLTLTGPASVAGFEAALRSVGYANTSEEPSTAPRTVSFTVYDGDLDSLAGSRTVTIASSNDSPTLVHNTGAAVPEGQAVTLTAAMLAVADVDNTAAALEYTLGSVPANGELRLSGIPLPAGGHFTQADIGAGQVSYLHDGSETTGDAFTFTVSDGAGGSIGATTFMIDVGAVNSAPVAADGSDAMVEDGAPLVVDLRGLVSDVETADANLDFEVVAGPAPAAGSLAATATNGVFSFDSASDFNGTASFSYRVSDRGDPDGCAAGPGCDGAKTSATHTFTIDVAPVDDGPVAADGSDAMVEDGAPLVVDLRGLVSDVETADANLDFEVVAGPAPAAGSLAATATNGVFSFDSASDFNGTASFSYRVSDRGDPDGCAAGPGCDGAKTSATHTFTIDVAPVDDGPVAADGSDAMVEDGAPLVVDLRGLVSDVETADANLDFEVVAGPAPAAGSLAATATNGVFSFDSASDFNGTASFDYRVSDRGDPDGCAAGPGCDGAKTSATHTFTIDVAPVDDGPVAADGSDAMVEDGAPLVVDLRGLVSDVETADANLDFEVVAGPAPAAGSLAATATNGVFSFDSASDFNGTASFSYRVSDRGDPDGCAAGPGCDGAKTSATHTFTIDVAPVDDGPVAADGSDAMVEDGAPLVVDLRGLVSDVETADANLDFEVVAGPAPAAGSLAATATNGVFSFDSASDFNGTASFDYRVSDRGDPDGCAAGPGCDGAKTSATHTFTIDVAPVNDAPAITSNGGGDTAALSVLENTTAAADVNANDPDAGATLTYSIGGGLDAGAFSIDSATGELLFQTAPNFEAPGDSNADNVYEVDVVVSDGALSDSQALSISVTDQVENQAPVITSNGGGAAASVSVVENTTAVTDVDATDPDSADTLTYTVAGGADQGLFHIDSSTGMLTFSDPPDFELPADANGDNVYEVDVSAGDGALNATQSLSVTVTDADETPANQPPAITSGGGGDTAELAVDEGATAAGIVTATDPEGTALAYSIVGGADAARFAIDPASGALSFTAPPDYENPADQNADNAYEVVVQASDGSLADVQSLVVRVRDENERPTGKLVSGLVTDEDVALVLHSAGGQATSVTDPDRTATAVRVALSVSSGTLTIPRRDRLSFELGDGSAADRLTFSGSLADVAAGLFGIVFTPAPNGYGVVTLTLGVSDPDVRNLSETSDTTIVVRPVNDPPVLEPIGDVHTEAGSAVSFTAQAHDIDGITLTYSLEGAPAGAEIDPTTGAFRWKPGAEQAPGAYSFRVVVDDGGAPDLTDRQAVTITVSAPAAPTPSTPPPPADTPAPLGRAPQARNDSARGTGAKGITIHVLGNDVIQAGDRVTVTVGKPEHGTVRVLADGSILYTPAPGFAGKDRFTYTITGPDGSSSAVVEVTVEGTVHTEVPPATAGTPEQADASWVGGPLLGGPSKRPVEEQSVPAPSSQPFNAGFLVMTRALLETVQGLDTPVQLLAVSGAWFALFALSLAVFRRRRAYLVDGVPRQGAVDVLDRPEGGRRYRLRHDDGPIWSIGRRRRVHGSTWVPVSTSAGSGFVELERLIALDRAVDSPQSVLRR